MELEKIFTEIVALCKEHGAVTVTLFGSRAKGTQRERSDIDIAVTGAKDFDLLVEQIEDIPTLYSIDVINMDQCGNELLREDIDKYGRKIYEKI